ncbi:MAG: protein-disulfide reductase DsbD [Methylococcaceae bacterium]|nr:protein-disulfide reductase DsbD [Methylococcaceae bacterium]
MTTFITPLSLKWLSYFTFWIATQAFAITPEELLPAEQAFQFNAKVIQQDNVDRLELTWDIADGYYLYRHKFKFHSLTPGILLEEVSFPASQSKLDVNFGKVEIYHGHLELLVNLRREDLSAKLLTVDVSFQGCAEIGVCYMPVKQTLTFNLPNQLTTPQASPGTTPTRANDSKPLISEQEGIAASLRGRSLSLIIFSFLGFGILLAFTPCVFPMIPILSGIIAGQGGRLTTRRSFMLSLSYVFASAVTYTIFGVLAGLFGNNLQAVFQEPWVIMVFSGLFVVLACSMLGAFTIQIPTAIQTKLVMISAKQQGGQLWGAALMGMLSTLAIGPCVTAPLAGALIYIGQTGDALLGGVALFSLGIGMGLPLLVIGTSAGKLLPKAGVWMHVTKGVFGIGLLAVAVWLLSRILPSEITLLLWGALLIIPLLYLGWKKLWKGAALVALTYGILLLIGVATHPQRDAMQLLCVAAITCEEHASLPFQKVSSAEQLQQILSQAHAQGRTVMLDFYADWCTSCKEMAVFTFSDPKVREALAPMLLVQADVTANLLEDQRLLKKFKLIGPPAILFFGPDQQERMTARVIGYMKADQFASN